MYKGILLDIDNTLYNYDPLHALAKKAVFDYMQVMFGFDLSTIESAFSQAKLQIKQNTPGLASSHNRILYLQNTCEILKLDSLEHSLPLYNIYWDSFLERLSLSSGAKSFLNSYGHIPICLLTDLTAHIQHRKIDKLGLGTWAKLMVTSEEAGCEKPHPFMYQLALAKLGLQSGEVCMIGDSYKKDIKGARRLGIDAYWLTQEGLDGDGIMCISDLGDIKW
jgi:HAD superfamily hydrolase (TIGR01549 family)